MEEWRAIVGYEDRYLVSNDGRVKSLDTLVRCRGNGYRMKKGKILPLRKNSRGYVTVSLCVDNIMHTKLIHRLVAEAFIPNDGNKPQVNHIDGNQSNNHVGNLEWVTDNENKHHSSIDNGGTQRPKRAVIAACISTGEAKRYEGLREAERCLSLEHKSALNVLKGRQHQTKGYTLCYV